MNIGERKGKYGCFLHPRKGHEVTGMDAPCPECGRPYSFPLTSTPQQIGDYIIEEALSRGFYAAIYKAVRGPLHRPYVLKVIPQKVYEFHGKDFDNECHLHHAVAEGTDHLVKIETFFIEEVQFGDVSVACHVAVLDYVEGEELDSFLQTDGKGNARTLAQLAIDLFRLLHELEQKQAYHNDLHSGNILVRSLPASLYRPEAIDETVRLVAVDLGSLADRSRSAPDRPALGDLGSVASFLRRFADPLLQDPDNITDSDYRLANVLVELASMMAGTAANLRTPDYEDFITQIKQAYHEAASPWSPPAGLRRLNDAYNAQTLHPCFVPRLLVDPGGEWLSAVSIGGPQVITGVRGCGKTMLLRALQFHARLSAHVEANQNADAPLQAVRGDGYVGLYLSARRLLDALGHSDGAVLHEPYARLLVGYAREAVRAGRHLHEVVSTALRPRWWQGIARAVMASVRGVEHLIEAVSPQVLDRRLQSVLFSLDRGEGAHALTTNPAIAFPSLAEAVLEVSASWEHCKIFYLLDDVSTRHLKEQNIAELLGTLLFNDEKCAFKLTTEGQTLELALKSPGLVERARADRDYEPFDLAARVNEKLKDPRRGKQFLAEILQLRAKQFARHPTTAPAALLGDASLEDIARNIVSTGRTAAERKETYHGLTALAAVCVGDIGDVLNIYDAILRKAGRPEPPIAPAVQNAAFQEYSSRRLYHLNRRNGELKDFAMAFAEAAYELLLRSARPKSANSKRQRLRQYAQLYVRITTGDEAFQFDKLRELIDAGVFVLESGSDSPRTKTRDSNPISQFILTYRKLFGLSQYIGLAFSDRFELSGDQLEAWLRNPEGGKTVLMKNLGGPLSDQEKKPAAGVQRPPKKSEPKPVTQLALIPGEPATAGGTDETTWPSVVQTGGRVDVTAERVPRTAELSEEELGKLAAKTIVIGLGFEDRCLASAERLLGRLGKSVNSAILVKYPEEGHGQAIKELVQSKIRDVRVVDYASAMSGETTDLPQGPVIVDVTGLAKPVLFRFVRSALLRDRSVIVAHTQATLHYPLDEDVAGILNAPEELDEFEILRRAGELWSGERTPYSFVPLLDVDSEDSRPLFLCAAASAKHERLLSLMNEREYEAADVVVPTRTSNRSRLAALAADVATRGVEAPNVKEIDSNDLQGMLHYLAGRFRSFYIDGGFSIEFGLTGSKMHSVACAAASTVFKIAQVWYVSPTQFDPERFTSGVGQSRYLRIDIQPTDRGSSRAGRKKDKARNVAR